MAISTSTTSGWGPAVCGHAHPEVIAALQEAIEKGTSLGHLALETPWPKW